MLGLLSFKGKEFRYEFIPGNIPTGQNPSWYSFVDEQSVRDRWWNIEEGDVIFDVGCAYGSYTLPALVLGASHCYCWNPLDSEMSILAQSLKHNGWEDKATLFMAGLYNKIGFLNPDTQEFSQEYKDGMFAVTTLDQYLEDQKIKLSNSRCWMKMDVEGAELEILKGGTKLLNQFRPNIIIENHVFKIADIQTQVQSFLESLNFKHVETVPYYTVSHSLYIP
jgi:FkbM family methyltransferase